MKQQKRSPKEQAELQKLLDAISFLKDRSDMLYAHAHCKIISDFDKKRTPSGRG